MSTRAGSPSSIEVLESRIAPAVIISPGGRVAHYTDFDGDLVTITVSKGRLSPADFVTSSEGALVPQGEALQVIDFSDDHGEFSGANVRIVARPGRYGGDGFAQIGFLNAGGGQTDLGSVFIDGDLAQIEAGDYNVSARSSGLKALTVRQLGGGWGSHVTGDIGALHVLQDLTGGSLVAVQHVGAVTINAGGLQLGFGSSSTTTQPSGGSLGFVKVGAGTLDLGPSNVFTGGTNLSGGTLSLGTTSLPASSGAVIKTGAGTLSLTGTNTYTGGGAISAGTVSVLNTSGLGVTSVNHLVVSGSGAVLTTGGSLTLNNSGVINSTTATSLAGGTLVSSGSVTNLATSTGAVIKTGAGTLDVGASVISTNAIISSGSLSISGASSLTFGSANGLASLPTRTPGGVLSFTSGNAPAGTAGTFTIELTSLDPAATGATTFEIPIGNSVVAIVQNRATYDNLIAAGWVPSASTFTSAGTLASVKLTKTVPTVITPSAGTLTIQPAAPTPITSIFTP